MKAVRYWGKEDVRCEEVAKPAIVEGEALIKVGYAGICGSDLYIYSGTHPRAKAPLILGHEFAGEIVELPRNHRGQFKIGDVVAVNPLLYCQRCTPCYTGNAHVCQSLGLLGIDRDGGFAEFARAKLSQLVKLPPVVPGELGALVEPLAVAVHAVRSSDLRLGDLVLVLGGGPIGFLTAFAARANGAGRVIIIEPNDFRRMFAGNMGFDVLTPADQEEIKAITRGEGADIVFEAAGIPASMEGAIKNCKIRGQVVVVGVFKHPVPVDLQRVNFAEIRIIGTRVYREVDFAYAVDLITKYPEIGKLVTHKMNLTEAQKGLDLAKLGSNTMKVLLHP